jgi:hypothetical protein
MVQSRVSFSAGCQSWAQADSDQSTTPTSKKVTLFLKRVYNLLKQPTSGDTKPLTL